MPGETLKYFKQNMNVHSCFTYNNNNRNASKPSVHQQVTEQTNGDVQAEKCHSVIRRNELPQHDLLGESQAPRADGSQTHRAQTARLHAAKLSPVTESRAGLPGLGREGADHEGHRELPAVTECSTS